MEPVPDRPGVPPTPGGTALGLLSLGLFLGLLGGLGLSSWWHGRHPVPAAPATPVTDQQRELLQGLQRMESAANRVGEAAEKLAAVYDHQRPPSAAPAAPAGTPARGDGLVPWLPAEGVPLAKAWYGRKLQAELQNLAAAAADPRRRVGAKATDDQVARAQRDWKARAEKLVDDLDALQRVASELQLARWLDESGWGTRPPKAWQLAELAAELRKHG